MELSCRVCLQVEELMVHIYDEVEDFQSNLSILLELCGGLKVEKHDNYPKYLCKECTSELLIAVKFREKCIQSQKILQQVAPELQNATFYNQTQYKEVTMQEQTYIKEEALKLPEPDIVIPLEDVAELDVVTAAGNQQLLLYGESHSDVKVDVEGDVQEYYKSISSSNAIDIDPPTSILEPLENVGNSSIVCKVSDPAVSNDTNDLLVLKQLKTYTPHSFLEDSLQFKCDICGAGFAQTTNLKRHMEKFHSTKKLYLCLNCQYCCSSQEHFEQHDNKCNNSCYSTVMQASGKRNLQSTTDGKKQKRKTLSGGHICSYCGKHQQSQFALNMHIRTHTGDRPYACEFCEKSFKTQSALTTHTKRHAGLPDYACEVCGKTFYETSNLNIHMRSHTGFKPHKCTMCEKSFARIFLLQLHMRTHTKEKPYQCHLCERAFAQLCDLKYHIRTHTGENRMYCPACRKTFTKNRALKLHWEKYHALDMINESDVSMPVQDAEVFNQKDLIFTADSTQNLDHILDLSSLIEEDCVTDYLI